MFTNLYIDCGYSFKFIFLQIPVNKKKEQSNQKFVLSAERYNQYRTLDIFYSLACYSYVYILYILASLYLTCINYYSGIIYVYFIYIYHFYILLFYFYLYFHYLFMYITYVLHMYEYECVWEYVRVQRLVELKNAIKDGETKRMPRHVQCVSTNILSITY